MIRIALSEYDPRWPQAFGEHRRRIRAALGERAARIEHVGSTSVPGLAAKPVIDIIIEGIEPADESIRETLENAGYHVGVDEPGHRMYEPPKLDAHIHLWSEQADAGRHIVFRDWLRAHPEDRALYEHVKRELAKRPWETSNHYAQAKTAVVETILRRARGELSAPRIDRFFHVLDDHLRQHARVLEIGAGEGTLAARLAAAGYDVVALDKNLRSMYPITEVSFEAYRAPPRSFDCVAAQLVLHHAGDLPATVHKIGELLKRDGVVAIDDYGWERSRDSRFRNDRAELHTSDAMLEYLRETFVEIFYADHAYVSDGAGADSLGFTFIGRPR